MKTKIIKLGNSAGICIPKIILEQCHMDSVVDIQILENKLIINPVGKEAKESFEKKLSETDIKAGDCCWYEDETEWK